LEAIGGSCRRNWLADIILQGTGDAVGFGVEVEHGRFEAVVTQDDLQVAYQGAALEGMGCERVAQAVRSESLQMSPKSGQVDGSLDITFVAAPAHESLAARVAADPTGGEEPGPAFGASRIRVFLGQESGQGYREVVGPIQLGLSFGQSQLAFQRLGQALRKEHDPAFTAFGLVEVESALFEVDILDAQVQGLAHTQTAGVQEMHNQASGVTAHIGHGGQELEDLGAVRAVPEGGGSMGA